MFSLPGQVGDKDSLAGVGIRFQPTAYPELLEAGSRCAGICGSFVSAATKVSLKRNYTVRVPVASEHTNILSICGTSSCTVVSTVQRHLVFAEMINIDTFGSTVCGVQPDIRG